jgi:hypothetical protein
VTECLAGAKIEMEMWMLEILEVPGCYDAKRFPERDCAMDSGSHASRWIVIRHVENSVRKLLVSATQPNPRRRHRGRVRSPVCAGIPRVHFPARGVHESTVRYPQQPSAVALQGSRTHDLTHRTAATYAPGLLRMLAVVNRDIDEPSLSLNALIVEAERGRVNVWREKLYGVGRDLAILTLLDNQ